MLRGFRVRYNIIHKVAYSSQGYLVGDSNVEIALQLQDDIYDIHGVETQLVAEVAADTQAPRLNGFALADDTQHLLLNGFGGRCSN